MSIFSTPTDPIIMEVALVLLAVQFLPFIGLFFMTKSEDKD